MRSSLKLTELGAGFYGSDRNTVWVADEIPAEHLWAYNHLIEHDCGSISCGKTIYQLLPDIPTDRELAPSDLL